MRMVAVQRMRKVRRRRRVVTTVILTVMTMAVTAMN